MIPLDIVTVDTCDYTYNDIWKCATPLHVFSVLDWSFCFFLHFKIFVNIVYTWVMAPFWYVLMDFLSKNLVQIYLFVYHDFYDYIQIF